MEQNQHPVLTQLNQEIQDLNDQVTFLRSERDRILTNYSQDVENVRLILLDALSIEQSGNVDVNILANSIADVFAISLLKSVTVTFPITVEATMLVPADFDVDNLEIGNVDIDCYNSDVEDFSVESFEIGAIEEE
jgi:hypothetical protein